MRTPRKDLVGDRFGRLIVLNYEYKSGHGTPYWKCRCDCGNTKIISAYSLKYGTTASCGCLRKEKFYESLTNLVGQRFDRLVVNSLDHYSNKQRYWKCVCDCGNEAIINTAALLNGHTKSCGCIHKELFELHRVINKKYDTDDERRKVNAVYMRKRNKTIEGRVTAARGKHTRRDREKSTLNDLTKKDIEFLYKLQDGICVSCRKSLDNYHIDHIIPVSKGGGLTLSNVQLLCPFCNQSKNDKTINYLYTYLLEKEEVEGNVLLRNKNL
jgi:5-methylcytosine-specific restriction endonuclease McrA